VNLYDVIVHAGYPLRRWARLEAHGDDRLPAEGPLIIVANHDSMLDPIAVGGACHPARYVRFLAMAELWNNRILRVVLDKLGQIPIERSGGGGGTQALRSAIAALKKGETVCIFPEGRLSRGRSLRARSGLAQLITACPDVPVVLAAVTGADDVVRFPKRPRARVTFLTPAMGEAPSELPQRLLDQIRALAPPVAAGRHGRLATQLRERRAQRRGARRPARPGAGETRPS
jgi:1-acyl-sn-glycerol-3-phosphate acyltransferase